jgi:cytoskeletal protein CcmA (bactofilin family)
MFGSNAAIETLVGRTCDIKGDITAKNSIRVDGRIEGHLKCSETVVVAENASVKGDIEAKYVVIGGKVIGDVIASAKLEILHTGELYGDIRTPKLVIAEGVIFEGTCEMEKAVQEASAVKK